MNKIDVYDVIGGVAMIVTPLAAAILFGYELYLYLIEKGVPPTLAVIGGISGAIAIEASGVISGHLVMDMWKTRDWRGVFPAAAMVFYVWFGYSKIPEYGEIFVLAGFVYLLVALKLEVKESKAEAKIENQTAVAEAKQAEREVKQKEDEREAREQKLEDEREAFAREEKAKDNEARRARYMAKTQEKSSVIPVVPVVPVTNNGANGHNGSNGSNGGHVSKVSALAYLPSDYRLLSSDQKRLLIDLTTSEIQKAAGISSSSARRWKAKVKSEVIA